MVDAVLETTGEEPCACARLCVVQIDPSGSYFAWKASAIGKNMTNAKAFLEKRYSEEVGLQGMHAAARCVCVCLSTCSSSSSRRGALLWIGNTPCLASRCNASRSMFHVTPSCSCRTSRWRWLCT